MNSQPYAHITVRPLSSALGADITGVDIGRGLSGEVFAEIRRAFFENLVIMIHAQDLTEQQQCDFAARFGRLTKSAGLKG
ncbi:MAG TPA: TauD/TfdA family dioxygenase, partial [Variovorax sp.]